MHLQPNHVSYYDDVYAPCKENDDVYILLLMQYILLMNLIFICYEYTSCSENGGMHICILAPFDSVYTSSERNCSTLFRKCSIHFLKNGSIYSLSICWYIPPKNGSIYSFNFVGIYSFKKSAYTTYKGSTDLFTKKMQYMPSM